MATRSTIALEFADGTVQAVYCHWDGYLAHNGSILAKHYSNPFILRDLIDQGAISSLKPTVGTKHAFSQFDTPTLDQTAYEHLYGNMTTFYARDRGEDLKIDKFKDIKDYHENLQGEEYDYILCQRNGKAQWFVRSYRTDGNWIPLEMAFVNDEVAEEN